MDSSNDELVIQGEGEDFYGNFQQNNYKENSKKTKFETQIDSKIAELEHEANLVGELKVINRQIKSENASLKTSLSTTKSVLNQKDKKIADLMDKLEELEKDLESKMYEILILKESK